MPVCGFHNERYLIRRGRRPSASIAISQLLPRLVPRAEAVQSLRLFCFCTILSKLFKAVQRIKYICGKGEAKNAYVIGESFVLLSHSVNIGQAAGMA